MRIGHAIGYGISGGYLGGKHPLFVSYSLTRRCNSRCSYCGVDQKPVEEMDLPAVQKIFKQMAGLGLQRVALTGGEPLLHPDFDRIVDFLVSMKIEVSCITNGLLMAEHLEAMAKMRSVTVSLDGPEEIHESARAKGSFELASEAIRLAKKRGIPVRMRAVLANHNIDHVDEVVEVARKLQVPLWVTPVLKQGMDEQKIDMDLPESDRMKTAISRLIQMKAGSRPVANSKATLKHMAQWPKDTPIGCLAGRLTFRLEPNGMFTHCHRIPGKPPWIDLTAVPVWEAIENLPYGGCSQCWEGIQVEMQLARKLKISSIRTLLRGLRSPRD